MITVRELAEKLSLRQLTSLENLDASVRDGCVCDLLSWVMARGEEGMAWITVQTHLNVVAVACLHDFACVIIPEDIEVPAPTLQKANEEEMPVFGSPQTAYRLCCLMNSLGIGS